VDDDDDDDDEEEEDDDDDDGEVEDDEYDMRGIYEGEGEVFMDPNGKPYAANAKVFLNVGGGVKIAHDKRAPSQHFLGWREVALDIYVVKKTCLLASLI
jgi:hypothetical protein